MQKLKRPILIQSCFFMIAFLMLAGCKQTATLIEPKPMTTATIATNIDWMPTEISMAETLQPVIATKIPQSTPTAMLPTISPSAIQPNTPTPTPTLSREQIAENFTNLLTQNAGCELPCWWGIVPGETRIETIPTQFVPQGFIWREEWLELSSERAKLSATIWFDVENGVVQTIHVWGGLGAENSADNWARYGLDQVLKRYGVPSQLFVYNQWQGDPGPLFYQLLLFYESMGIVIDYTGVADYPIDGKSQVCPDLSEMTLIRLFLYEPQTIENVVEQILPIEEVDFVVPSGTVYDLISWEQMVGTSLQSFYETFKDSDSNSCFAFTMQQHR